MSQYVSVWSKYVKEREISKGAYGEVLLAHSKDDPEDKVAIKRIKSADGVGITVDTLSEIRMFSRVRAELEGGDRRALHLLSSREVLFEQDSGDAFIVMEFMVNSLSGLLASSQVLKDGDRRAFAEQILHGMAKMHDMRMIHRDIKTDNVFVAQDGRLVLGDFGMAVPTGLASQTLSSVIGTSGYRAPEVVLGATVYGPYVDMFSIGCMLAKILTGREVFEMQAVDGKVSQVTEVKAMLDVLGSPPQDYRVISVENQDQVRALLRDTIPSFSLADKLAGVPPCLAPIADVVLNTVTWSTRRWTAQQCLAHISQCTVPATPPEDLPTLRLKRFEEERAKNAGYVVAAEMEFSDDNEENIRDRIAYGNGALVGGAGARVDDIDRSNWQVGDRTLVERNRAAMCASPPTCNLDLTLSGPSIRAPDF